MLALSSGQEPISTTIASIAGGTGLTTFTIASATGLPATTGGFIVARIADGTGSAENVICTLSGTTVTCSATTAAHSNGDAIAFGVLSKAALDAFKDDAISGYPENALSAAGALVKGTAVTNRITITSAAATFTLADGTYKGELCRIVIDRTSTKLATIDPDSTTTIDGATTRVMWAGESAILAWTGAEWEKRAGKSIPMKACGTITPASSTGSTYTKQPIGASVVDNTGAMVNTGNGRIDIKRPGDYIAWFYIKVANTPSAGNMYVAPAVNGTATGDDQYIYAPSAAYPYWGGAASLLGLALSDYVELQHGNYLATLTPNSGYLSLVEVPSW